MRSSKAASTGKKLSTSPSMTRYSSSDGCSIFVSRLIAAADLGEGGAVVAVDGDEEALGVEAMHLDEPVVVWCSAIDDHKDEVVVLVELGALVELLRVFDRERMKLEHIAEDLEVLLARLIEVEPKEVAAASSRSTVSRSKWISRLP
jgi:hypothetical protein